MLYRIFTEDKNRKTIIKLTSRLFDGFTVFQTVGYWKGTPERSLTIEIVGAKRQDVRDLARAIKQINKQEAVLVQAIESTSTLI